MGTNVLLPSGYTWTEPDYTKVRKMIDQSHVFTQLVELRDQWQEATGGNLQSVNLDLGLFFDDLFSIIEGKEVTLVR